uniref:Putative secreted protein n=1 Tax=Ixodes ricinus TaxID=34613 RepID=A0A6B0U4J8_IXORI
MFRGHFVPLKGRRVLRKSILSCATLIRLSRGLSRSHLVPSFLTSCTQVQPVGASPKKPFLVLLLVLMRTQLVGVFDGTRSSNPDAHSVCCFRSYRK